MRATTVCDYINLCLPAYGRLNDVRGDGWCAKELDRTDDWLQVDLGKIFEVCGVATQGDANGNEWVINFTLSYSFTGSNYQTYNDSNGVKMVRFYYIYRTVLLLQTL